MTPTNKLDLRSKIVAAMLALCLVGMLCVLLYSRLLNPSLTIQVKQIPQMPQMSNDNSSIGMLMEQVAAKPTDLKLLLQLVHALMQANQWGPAENFAHRARLLAPDEFEPHFLLGVIQHNKGADIDASGTLEKAISLRDDASARYSLAILYLYYLNQPEQGLEHLKRALTSQNLPPQLKQTIEAELALQAKKTEVKK